MDQIHAVAHPSQRCPGSPGQEGVDWTSQALGAGKDDPGEDQGPGQSVEAIVESSGSQRSWF